MTAAGLTGQGVEAHPFVVRVLQSLEESGVSTDVFEKWQEQIRTHFRKRNFYGLKLDRGSEHQVDTRPLFGHFDSIRDVVLELSNTVSKLVEKVNAVVETQGSIVRLLDKMNNRLDHVERASPKPSSDSGEEGLATGDDQTGTLGDVHHGHPAPWPRQRRQKQLYRAEELKREDIRGIFKLWFQDQLPVRWYNGEGGNRRSRNQFSAIKKVVEVLLKQLDEYPEPDCDLEIVATLAVDRLMQNHSLVKMPSRSSIANNSKRKIKTANGGKSVLIPSLLEAGKYEEKGFPHGTPTCVEEFFNSRGNNPDASKKRGRQGGGDGSD